MVKVKTVEFVSPGHPDKIADQISDHLLDYMLLQNKNNKVAIETFITGTKDDGLIVVGGESTQGIDDTVLEYEVEQITRKTIKTLTDEFGYYDIKNVITKQSTEINKAVNKNKNVGAGDQGIMVGCATNTTETYLPKTYDLARTLQIQLWQLQNQRTDLELDSKVQVTESPDDYKIVFSIQHRKNYERTSLHKELQEICKTFTDKPFKIYLNPSGSFIKGGPAADTGLTGRKIVVDAYGPEIPVGGGAFSGKDPSKVDRSGAYAARHLAKNIVGHGLADRCIVRLAYVIGKVNPYELSINTFDTLKTSQRVLDSFLKEFSMQPKTIIERLDLLNINYLENSEFGHFGKPDSPWEKLI